LTDLNPAQRDAVTHGDGPLLVVAGAGTGKTKTLACRVAHLITRGVPPNRILLLTFTRRAAAEMLRRAGAAIGGSNENVTAKVWGGTFHAIANRLLRTYASAVNLSGDFTVMDEGDAADLMNLLRNELGFAKKERRFPRKRTLLGIYSRMVNAQSTLRKTLKRQFPWCDDDRQAIKEIFDLYVARKSDQHLLDYDDLLLFWSAMTSAPGVGESVADRFDHVLVDEYQDTNAVQAEILRGMRQNKKDIMVVGDDAQSIYAFRAATIRNILDFPKQFPGTRIVTLEQNYRSTGPILAASNAVMSEARERYTKELWSQRASDQKPVLTTCLDENQQTAVVCGYILEHLEQGTPLMNQAVLFRASHHSAQLEVELTSRNIPFHKFGGLKFVETAHIKDMLAIMRILENPLDQISWFRVLQLFDGVGPRTAARIMEALGVREASPGENPRTRRDDRSDAAPRSPLKLLLDDPPTVPPAAREQFERLRTCLANCGGANVKRSDTEMPDGDGTRPAEPPVPTQVEIVRRFYEPLCERIFDNAVIRLRDIEQLSQIASRYRSRGRFITDLTLDPPKATSVLAQPPFLEEDYLTLSTIHSAKGCEWDIVHVIHAADGMIPSDMAVGDDEGVEEERRLFYVAMTRAKDWLYVYFPLRYYHRRFGLSDAHGYAQRTRFINDETRSLFEVRTTEGDGQESEERVVDIESDTYARVSRLWQDED
jgi:DNA helicase-2/ATP-dependent DNA helicase PcrA